MNTFLLMINVCFTILPSILYNIAMLSSHMFHTKYTVIEPSAVQKCIIQITHMEILLYARSNRIAGQRT